MGFLGALSVDFQFSEMGGCCTLVFGFGHSYYCTFIFFHMSYLNCGNTRRDVCALCSFPSVVLYLSRMKKRESSILGLLQLQQAVGIL